MSWSEGCELRSEGCELGSEGCELALGVRVVSWPWE